MPKKGVIYILTNPSFPDYIKIGFASDIEKRLKQLNRSETIPFAFRTYAVYEVGSALTDKELHKLIDTLNPDLRSIETFDGKERVKEFYAMSPEDAYSLLESIAKISGTTDRLMRMAPEGHEPIDEPVQVSTQPVKQITKGDYSKLPEGVYYMKRNVKSWGTVTGKMEYKDGKFIVKAGSVCCPIRGNGWTTTKVIDESRERCLIVDNILQEDVEFNSPSSAAAMLTWKPEDGWLEWKTENGEPIKTILS